MPDIEHNDRRAEFIAALAVPCPYCKAREHNDCRTLRGGNWNVWPPHKRRIDAAKALEAT